VRIGIVGCGRATEDLHLPALRRVRGAEVAALADTDTDRLRRVAECFGVPGRFESVEDLLAGTEVELVAVCVPTTRHAEVAEAVLGAGLHVLVEKPLALELAEADRMVAAAEAADRFAAVGFNLRCHRLVRQARDVIRAGRLGEVQLLRSVWTAPEDIGREWPQWRFSRVAGGGAINEVAVHHIDLWRFLLDSEVAEVHAFSASAEHQDHTVTLSGRMTSGVLVSSSFCQRSSARNELEVYGRGASLALSLYRADSLQLQRPGELEGGAPERLRRLLTRAAQLPTVVRVGRAGGDFLLSYRHQWDRVIRRVRQGQAPDATFEDGRDALRVVRAAIQSVETNRPVVVDEGVR